MSSEGPFAPGDTIPKDPDAVLPYDFDWTDWLDGATIATRTVTVSSGLTKDSDSIMAGSLKVRVWLSGGTAGQTYTVACKITTSDNRTDERTVSIAVMQR